jgi:hypothetical protein
MDRLASLGLLVTQSCFARRQMLASSHAALDVPRARGAADVVFNVTTGCSGPEAAVEDGFDDILVASAGGLSVRVCAVRCCAGVARHEQGAAH